MRIDWFRILADLRRAKLGNRAAARRLGVAKSTVIGWKQGNEPRHADGERLLRLWMDETDQTRDQVPMRSPGDWR
jgi:hypothetical protein